LQFLQEYRFIVFGPILIALVIFLPNGIVGLYQSRKHRRARRVAPVDGRGAVQSTHQPQPTHGDRHA
jgi:branched-chain amino acid transport system permease protein